MKHTYKIYYFLLLGLFLMEIPHTVFAAYTVNSKKAEGIQQAMDNIQQDVNPSVKDTIGIEYIAATQEEVTEPRLGLYPNPTAGSVTLSIREDGWHGGTVSIYNIIGQLVAQKSIDEEEIDFDLTDRSQGIYLVTLRNGEAQKTLRLVKK